MTAVAFVLLVAVGIGVKLGGRRLAEWVEKRSNASR